MNNTALHILYYLSLSPKLWLILEFSASSVDFLSDGYIQTFGPNTHVGTSATVERAAETTPSSTAKCH